MIRPTELEFYQEFLSIETLERRPDLRLKVTFDRSGVLVIKLGLEAFNLLDAKIVNSTVDFHVLALSENHSSITCRQECLQGLQSLLPQIRPFSIKHLVVVDYHVIELLAVGRRGGPRSGKRLLLCHHINCFLVALLNF